MNPAIPDAPGNTPGKREKARRPGLIAFSLASLLVVWAFTTWADSTKYGVLPIIYRSLDSDLFARELGAALIPWLAGLIAAFWSFKTTATTTNVGSYAASAILPAIVISGLLFLQFMGADKAGPPETNVRSAEIKLLSVLERHYTANFNEYANTIQTSFDTNNSSADQTGYLLMPSFVSLVKSQKPFMSNEVATSGIAIIDDTLAFFQGKSVDDCVSTVGIGGEAKSITSSGLPDVLQARNINWYAEFLKQTATHPRKADDAGTGRALLANVGRQAIELVPADERSTVPGLFRQGTPPTSEFEKQTYCDAWKAMFDVVRKLPPDEGATILRTDFGGAGAGSPAGVGAAP
jgi:hypothetical protein